MTFHFKSRVTSLVPQVAAVFGPAEFECALSGDMSNGQYFYELDIGRYLKGYIGRFTKDDLFKLKKYL